MTMPTSPTLAKQCSFYASNWGGLVDAVLYHLTSFPKDPSAPAFQNAAQLFNAAISEERSQYRWTLTRTCVTSGPVYHVKVSDLLAICPRLARETNRPDALILLDQIPTPFPNQTSLSRFSLEPWLQNQVWPMADHAQLLSLVPQMRHEQISILLEKLRYEDRPCAGYQDQPDSRLDVQMIRDLGFDYQSHQTVYRAQVQKLAQQWQIGANPQLDDLCQTLFSSPVFGPRFLIELGIAQPELFASIHQDRIVASLVFLLLIENQEIYGKCHDGLNLLSLSQAKSIARVASYLPQGKLDLPRYRFTSSSYSSSNQDLATLEQFQIRLDQFVSRDPEIQPFQSLQGKHWFWNSAVVSGSAMTWAIPKLSSRKCLSKEEEMRLLYADADLDIPCRANTLAGFLEFVARTAQHLDGILEQKGTIELERSTRMYLIRNDDDLVVDVASDSEEQYWDRYHAASCLTMSSYQPTEIERAFYAVPRDQIRTETYRISESEYQRIYPEWAKSSNLEIDMVSSPVRLCHFSDHLGLGCSATRGQLHVFQQASFSQNVKITYRNERLIRPFQFYMAGNNLPAHVSRYHLECVRAFYDGQDLFLTPSAAIAFATHTVHSPWGNQTGQYASTVRKYANRGYQVQYCDLQQDAEALQGNDDPLAPVVLNQYQSHGF